MCDQQSLRSACAYAQSDQSLCSSIEYSMNVKLLTEHHLEFLSLKGGCTGSSESTLVKMPHCWKSHVASHIVTGLFYLGEKLLYKNWASGQPGLFGSYEDCALMEIGDGGKWHDYACHGVLFNTQNHGWVCEYSK